MIDQETTKERGRFQYYTRSQCHLFTSEGRGPSNSTNWCRDQDPSSWGPGRSVTSQSNSLVFKHPTQSGTVSISYQRELKLAITRNSLASRSRRFADYSLALVSRSFAALTVLLSSDDRSVAAPTLLLL